MMQKNQKVLIYRPEIEEINDSKTWPTWSKDISTFDWYYDEKEKFYVVEGEVEVTLDDGTKVEIRSGDMVVFEKGVKCTWNIKKPIYKHYTFLT
ncbi:MAG: cupin domain-containing protein [Candidatus Calescibacterium sp.]|nr:cupin domain-containing protein [Candidatus Calescibacterium sp.]